MLSREGQAKAVATGCEQAEALRAPSGRMKAAVDAAFRDTADAGSYVPRTATERVLGQLESCVIEKRAPAILDADPGMGKTMLLRVLAKRLADRCHCVFLPYGSLSLPDLCDWALGRMGEARPSDPVRALLMVALRRQATGMALALLVDDASGLKPEAARELGALVLEANGGLRLVLSSPNDSRGARVAAALGCDLFSVRLHERMSLTETSDFIFSRMNRTGVPRVAQRRFEPERLEWIHLKSRGIPRLVQRLGHLTLSDLPTDVRPSLDPTEEWLDIRLDELSPVTRDDELGPPTAASPSSGLGPS